MVNQKSSCGYELIVEQQNRLIASTNRILAVALSEIHTVSRRFRFWIFCVLLVLIAITGYWFSSMYLQYGAVYSPSFGIATPRYLLGNISPYVVLAFQLGALILLFDSSTRNARERIEETLNSKPVLNFEYLLGRVLGVSVLLYIVTVLIVSTLHFFGLMCEMAGFHFAEPFQIHSVMNLLVVDAPVTFIAWSSVVVLLTNIVRLRIGVAILGFVLIAAWTFVVFEPPYSFLAITSASSNDPLFISEILPEFASVATLGMRIATVIFACALILFASLFGRIDDVSAATKYGGGIAAVVSCGALCGLVVWSVMQHYYEEPAKWRAVHESYASSGSVDILEINGFVRINPKTSLFIDLELLLKSENSEKLVFTFNPGMKIQELKLDGQPATYSFQHGLLEVQIDEILESAEALRMHIIAQGVPNPRFGYFNSAVDYLTNSSVPVQSVAMLGKDTSIYDDQYVALMSGAHWYPTRTSVSSTSTTARKGTDFFTVDLTVELVAKEWHVVGPGTSIKSSSDRIAEYHFRPNVAVSEINLFASEFERSTMEIDGMNFALYLHKKHAQYLHMWNGDLLSTLQDRVKDTLDDHVLRGLLLPTDTLNFVEVPNRLRTVEGGWRMNSLISSPNVVILKENGFPTVNMESLFSRLTPKESYVNDEVWLDRHLDLLMDYFGLALGTENPFAGFAELYWSHHTSASGEYAEILDEIILSLISPTETPFSIYSTFHIAELTQIMPPRSLLNQRLVFFVKARNQEQYFGSRIETWNNMEQTRLSTLSFSEDNQKNLEILLLKAREIASGIRSINDEEKVFAWLMNIREKFAGGTYSLIDLMSSAEQFDVQVDTFLYSWLRESDLPGYTISPLTVLRIANDEDGAKQFQATVFVHNEQPVDGVIQIRYPSESWANKYNWEEWVETPGVRIAANSTKRLNITTPYELRQIQFVPGLSLERIPFVIQVDSHIDVRWQNAAPRPFIEDTDWVPLKEEGIVVDDLDEGFVISQTDSPSELFISVGPTRWLNQDKLWIFEVDNGLPIFKDWSIFRMPKEIWHRNLDLGYGRHRKSTAVAWIPRNNSPNKVSFVAELPTTSTWAFEYHLPNEWGRVDIDSFTKIAYNLKVHNSGTTWNITFDTQSKDFSIGWNLVEQLKLEAGSVIVDVVGTLSPGLVYADAIRWNRVKD